jgi:hypothetical protein
MFAAENLTAKKIKIATPGHYYHNRSKNKVNPSGM